MIKSETIQETLIQKGLEANIPVINIKGNSANTSNVRYDAESALADIIHHVIEHHHCKHINFMAGTPGNPVSEKRLAIYRNILEEYGFYC